MSISNEEKSWRNFSHEASLERNKELLRTVEKLESEVNTLKNELKLALSTNSENQSGEDLVLQPRWRKILYQKQPYEDNYVDTTFLNELVKNANFTEYSLPEVIRGSMVVTQQISIVGLFTVLFIFTLNNTITLSFLLQSGVFVLLLGFLVKILTDASFSGKRLAESLQTLVLLFGSLFALSPVLRTLTAPFSNDTITSCTCILLLGHLFFHDYGYVNGDSEQFSAPVSLNAAIFASVLLGSRLPSNLHVFALVSIAIESFALFPMVRHSIKRYSVGLHYLLTALMAIFTFVLLLYISVTVATIFAFGIIFITIGCPFWLVFIQKYKNEIHGPWDEAVIVVQRRS